MNLMEAQNSINLILAFNMGASFIELFVELTDGDYHIFLTVNRYIYTSYIQIAASSEFNLYPAYKLTGCIPLFAWHICSLVLKQR